MASLNGSYHPCRALPGHPATITFHHPVAIVLSSFTFLNAVAETQGWKWKLFSSRTLMLLFLSSCRLPRLPGSRAIIVHTVFPIIS